MVENEAAYGWLFLCVLTWGQGHMLENNSKIVLSRLIERELQFQENNFKKANEDSVWEVILSSEAAICLLNDIKVKLDLDNLDDA